MVSVPTTASDVTTTSSTSANTLAGNKPSNTVNGDFLIAQAIFRNVGTLSAPAGWVWAGPSDTNENAGIFYKEIRDASTETSTYTFNATGGSSRCALTIFRVVGADPGSSFSTGPISVYTGSSSVIAPGITTYNANTLVLLVSQAQGSTTTAPSYNTPSGFTFISSQNVLNAGSTACSEQWIGYQVYSTPGATGNITISLSPTAAANSSAWLVQLLPPAGAAPQINSWAPFLTPGALDLPVPQMMGDSQSSVPTNVNAVDADATFSALDATIQTTTGYTAAPSVAPMLWQWDMPVTVPQFLGDRTQAPATAVYPPEAASTFVANDAQSSLSSNAVDADDTFAANDANPAVFTSITEAAFTVSALDATIQTQTGLTYSPPVIPPWFWQIYAPTVPQVLGDKTQSAVTAAQAVDADLTFIANDGQGSISVNAVDADGSFSANDSTSTVSTVTTEAAFSIGALDATVQTQTGLTYQPPVIPPWFWQFYAPTIPQILGDKTPAPATAAQALDADLTFIANDGQPSLAVNADFAPTSISSNDANSTVSTSITEATATFSALDATIQTQTGLTYQPPVIPPWFWQVYGPTTPQLLGDKTPAPANAVSATDADITITANDTQSSVAATSDNVALGVAANDPVAAVSVSAGSSLAIIGQDAQTALGVPSGGAASTWGALDATVTVSAQAPSVSLTVTAQDPQTAVLANAGTGSWVLVTDNAKITVTVFADYARVDFTAVNANQRGKKRGFSLFLFMDD